MKNWNRFQLFAFRIKRTLNWLLVLQNHIFGIQKNGLSARRSWCNRNRIRSWYDQTNPFDLTRQLMKDSFHEFWKTKLFIMASSSREMKTFVGCNEWKVSFGIENGKLEPQAKSFVAYLICCWVLHAIHWCEHDLFGYLVTMCKCTDVLCTSISFR